MTKKQKRRFIAGATCPECRAVDTLMLYFENNIEKLQCVACHYSQSQAKEEVAAETRAQENLIGVFKP